MGTMPGANDKASALFTMFNAFGSILGPILGSLLYKHFGIHTTCDIFAIASVSMAVLFFMMNIWPGFLLNPALKTINQEEAAAGVNSNLIDDKGRISRAISNVHEAKAHDSRIVLSVRGSTGLDMLPPVT